MMSLCSIVFLLVIACALPIHAQALWTLTDSDFKSQTVALNAIDASGLHVSRSGAGGDEVIALDRFLQLSRSLPETKAEKFTLYLANGDLLAGEPVSLRQDILQWKNPLLGEMAIPLRLIRTLAAAGKTPTDERRKEDVVILGNGDTVRGIIAGLSDGKLSVQAEGATTDVPLASVATVSFAITGAAPAAVPGFRVRLDDGTAVTALKPALRDNSLSVTIRDEPAKGIVLAHISGIEQINGPVSWLSSRIPSEDLYVPFFGNTLTWPAKMDRNVDGSQIRFNDQAFSHGIGVHAFSRLSWALDGSFEAFRTRYAIAGDAPLADVAVRILLDDKVVYKQAHFRAEMLSPVVIEDLKGASKLTLEVDFGSSGETQDRLSWIEPALLRHKPAPVPAPATQPASQTAPTTLPSTIPASP